MTRMERQTEKGTLLACARGSIKIMERERETKQKTNGRKKKGKERKEK
jgi:hypothetical protein